VNPKFFLKAVFFTASKTQSARHVELQPGSVGEAHNVHCPDAFKGNKGDSGKTHVLQILVVFIFASPFFLKGKVII
jgi:hypothetical protein